MARSSGQRPERSGNAQRGQARGQSNSPQSGVYYTGRQPEQNQRNTLTPEQRKARQKRRKELLRRRRRHRRLAFALLFLVVVFSAFFLIRHFNPPAESSKEVTLDELDAAEEEDEVGYNGPATATIAFVGDISTSSDQVAAVTKSDGTYDFSQAFLELEDYFSDVDYAVGDFETTMVDGLAYGTEPYYNSPVQLAGALRTLGFRLMSTANTYMLNNGVEGLNSTKNYLTQAKLRGIGTYLSQEERDKNGGAYIRTIHKIKFAFLSYTKGTDSVRMPEGKEYALNTLYQDYSDYWTDLKSSQIRQDIQAAKDAGAEVIVALVHWGSEYGRSISEPQKKAEELLLENGVDVIIGSHSHLVSEMGFRTVERMDGTTKTCFVAYSLGDFYTDPEQENAQNSVILNLTFSKNANGGVIIEDASYVPIYNNITEIDGQRQFALLDVYHDLASLQRSSEISAEEAVLFNKLLGAVEMLHDYAGEELDAGPSESDRRLVEKAMEHGEYSAAAIKELQRQEFAAEKAEQETPGTAEETAGETSPEAENTKE